MEKPSRIYELLVDHADSDMPVTELTIGLVWTVCKAEQLGLAMSPRQPHPHLAVAWHFGGQNAGRTGRLGYRLGALQSYRGYGGY